MPSSYLRWNSIFAVTRNPVPTRASGPALDSGARSLARRDRNPQKVRKSASSRVRGRGMSTRPLTCRRWERRTSVSAPTTASCSSASTLSRQPLHPQDKAGEAVPRVRQGYHREGGSGDGIDNDCDGLIDEEVENMLDDDGDGSIDEDTSAQCASDVNSRTPRSGDLQRAVADPMTQFYDYDDDESGMPLLAVIISLSTAIFAVILVISIFLLMELMTRRRQIRNTKIRPFVS
ncbi:hypothetical protein C0Q70_04799 [Pomacea canaliculata]|uniref:Uncharacterized protein n=1 Tax=Pomacea canaliculata TaxID=400727 RepID=A0A2T7PJH8_POMCA|nr:hypothetical protein C0Q70_04799 [Pomacea canaliculata]